MRSVAVQSVFAALPCALATPTTATYENWRLTEEVLPDDTRRHASFDIVAYPGEVRLSPDNVSHADGGVLFYHCNPPDNWLGELKIRQQGLQAFRDEIPDDLSNRTFGRFMTSDGFQPDGETTGVYQTREYKGWQLRSGKPGRRHHLRIITHIEQAATLELWEKKLVELKDKSKTDSKAARA